MQLDLLNQLFLELSQVATVKTKREVLAERETNALKGDCSTLGGQLTETRFLYNDLLMQISDKVPGESRHKAAKRILSQHESSLRAKTGEPNVQV